MSTKIPVHPIDGVREFGVEWKAVIAADTAAEVAEQDRLAAHELFLTNPVEGEAALQAAPKSNGPTNDSPKPICG